MASEMIESTHYDKNFYDSHEDGSYRSAMEVVPILNEIFKPSSVIDIGCGTGVWLNVWKNQIGVADIQGVEGPYVNPDQLKVPASAVCFQDLKSDYISDKKYDLLTTLEVAEHLPESRAETFVKMLTKLSDVIVFSAAIPGQEGTYHINEQYPEYWAKHFDKQGYLPFDFIRNQIWNNDKIEWWYRQNILIFINKKKSSAIDSVTKISKPANPTLLTRIHPLLFEYRLSQIAKTKTFIGYIRWKLYPLKKAIFKN